MADTVTSQFIEDGPRWLIGIFTDVSDGTGETAVVKVDATSTGGHGVVIAGQTYYPGVHLKIREVEWVVSAGFAVQLLWKATTNTTIMTLTGTDHQKFDRFGGIPNPKGTGATGSILFTTINASMDATYSIVLRMTKGIPQS